MNRDPVGEIIDSTTQEALRRQHMEAQYKGKCLWCGNAIKPGDLINQNDQGTWLHDACLIEYEEGD